MCLPQGSEEPFVLLDNQQQKTGNYQNKKDKKTENGYAGESASINQSSGLFDIKCGLIRLIGAS